MSFENGKIYDVIKDNIVIKMKFIAGDFVEVDTGIAWDIESLELAGWIILQ